MSKTKIVEVEYTDDDILYYIDDEQGNEIGFAVMEDGKEVEYYYAESLGDRVDRTVGAVVDGMVGGVKGAIDENPFVSAEGVSHLKDDLNVIYKENQETISSLRSVAQDMRDLKDLFSGKPLKPRSEEKKTNDADDNEVDARAGMEMLEKRDIRSESKSESETISKASDVGQANMDAKLLLDADTREQLMTELREELRAELQSANGASASASTASEEG